MTRRKFAQLYDQLYEPIYRFIYFKVSSGEVAKDLASEVFLKAWQYIRKNKVKNPRALFYRMARARVIDYYRKVKPVALADQEVPIEDASTLDVYSALLQLKGSYKEAVILYYIEGYSQAEIADILERSTSSVGVLVHRGLKQLKVLLEIGAKDFKK